MTTFEIWTWSDFVGSKFDSNMNKNADFLSKRYMSRVPRLDFPDTIYHVFTRGVRQARIFHDDEDRWRFMSSLKRAQNRHSFDLLTYSLMTNHYHLELKTIDEKLSTSMHYLNLLYAGYYNDRYKQGGHVFQGRYHSIVVEQSTYLLRLSRYIHLNASKAGMVAKPEDYPWSSYNAYLGKVNDPLVKPQLVLDTLEPDVIRQQESYRKFVEDSLPNEENLSDRMLLKTKIFGSSDFHGKIFRKARALGLWLPSTGNSYV